MPEINVYFLDTFVILCIGYTIYTHSDKVIIN